MTDTDYIVHCTYRLTYSEIGNMCFMFMTKDMGHDNDSTQRQDFDMFLSFLMSNAHYTPLPYLLVVLRRPLNR